MIFGRKKDPKDPIVGVDVGTTTTLISWLSPDGTDRTVVKPDADGSPIIPTQAASLGPDAAVGHNATDLVAEGALTVDITAPFHIGRERWESNVVPLDEDPQDELRRRYFAYLYDLVAASVDNWEGRIAVPARSERPVAGQELLEEYLADSGFTVVRRIESPLATAIGYWEYDWHVDPHFELNRWDGGVVLSVDMGSRYVDAAVISVQGHTYRPLSIRSGVKNRTLIEEYAAVKAEQRGLDIDPSAENAPRRFGLLNPICQHLPDLVTGERQMVTVTVPETFDDDGGTQVTLTASEVETMVRNQLNSYGDIVQAAIADAGLDSLADIDLVVTGGMPSRWRPVLQWWASQGAAWGTMGNPEAEIDPDATVRMTSGIGGKLLGATGASAIGTADVGHSKENLEIA